MKWIELFQMDEIPSSPAVPRGAAGMMGVNKSFAASSPWEREMHAEEWPPAAVDGVEAIFTSLK